MDEQLDHSTTGPLEGDTTQARRGGMERRAAMKSMAAITALAATSAGRAEAQPAAQQYGLGLLPFFPLASGLLTGKYKRGEAAPDDTRFGKVARLRDQYVTPRNEEIVAKLMAFAQARGHTMLELAFSWLAARPQVSSVIAGATRVEQVEQNVEAIAWKLSAEEMAEIDQITK